MEPITTPTDNPRPRLLYCDCKEMRASSLWGFTGPTGRVYVAHLSCGSGVDEPVRRSRRITSATGRVIESSASGNPWDFDEFLCCFCGDVDFENPPNGHREYCSIVAVWRADQMTARISGNDQGYLPEVPIVYGVPNALNDMYKRGCFNKLGVTDK